MTKRIVVTTGLALFAMFFGAGNIVFPLVLGAREGTHIGYAMVAFLIAAVGVPFLGLFATSLYKGDYWEFFGRLGKVPALLLSLFLIAVTGPLFSIPRTETVSYHSLLAFLPPGLNNPVIFSLLYCSILFLLTYNQGKVIDIIGKYLSPVKLGTFIILILAGLLHTEAPLVNSEPLSSSIINGFVGGYGTMDLIGTFFYCTIIYRHLQTKMAAIGISSHRITIKLFLHSCIVGAIVLSFVYIGFMVIALNHASSLQGVDAAGIISAISKAILGNSGSFFVGLCVLLACITTATALTEVTTGFLYEHVVVKKIPRFCCLLATLSLIFMMSLLDFGGIMRLALPILEVLYPALIVYCILNIVLMAGWFQKDTTSEEVEALGFK